MERSGADNGCSSGWPGTVSGSQGFGRSGNNIYNPRRVCCIVRLVVMSLVEKRKQAIKAIVVAIES